MGANGVIRLVQAAIFPILAVVLAVAGWVGLRPAAPDPITEWLPQDASVSWVSMAGQLYSLQQGPVAKHGTTVAPDIALAVTGGQLWRVELNEAAGRTTTDDRVVALTFAVDDTIRLAGVEMTFGYLALSPTVPVLSPGLLAGGGYASDVEVTLRDDDRTKSTVPARVRVQTEPDGCAESQLGLTFGALTIELITTWCPQQGLTGFTFRQAGEGSPTEPAEAPIVPPVRMPAEPAWPDGPIHGRADQIDTRALTGSTSLWLGEPSAVVARADGVLLQAIEESVIATRLQAGEQDVIADVLWRVGGAGPIVGLATSDTMTFAADAAGYLTAATAAGGIVWRVRLPDAADAVVARDGLAFVHTVDGVLLAVDAYSGEVRWRSQVGPLTSPRALSVSSEVLALATFDSVLAFEPATGRELFTWTGLAPFGIVVAGERVYLGEAGLGLVAADRTGRLLWRVVNDVGATDLHATPNRIVLVGTGGAAAYDPSGERLWRRDGVFASALSAAQDGIVLIGRAAVELVGRDGQTLGRWQGVDSAVAISDVGIYGLALLR